MGPPRSGATDPYGPRRTGDLDGDLEPALGQSLGQTFTPLDRGHRTGRVGVQVEVVYLGHAAEAVDSVPLLVDAARRAHLDTPALDGLAALVEGRIEPEQWAATVTAPPRPKSRRSIRAA